jgi:hypothetical protein
VFKLTYNILSLFVNVHHARAICDHGSSMIWSDFFCRPRQDLHSFRDRCKPRFEKSGLKIFQDLACIGLESKFSRLRHLNFDPEPRLPFEIKQRFYAKNSVSVGICNLGRLFDFFFLFTIATILPKMLNM